LKKDTEYTLKTKKPSKEPSIEGLLSKNPFDLNKLEKRAKDLKPLPEPKHEKALAKQMDELKHLKEATGLKTLEEKPTKADPPVEKNLQSKALEKQLKVQEKTEKVLDK